MLNGIEIQELNAPPPEAVERMTFPAYRPFLSLQPAPRHPEEGDTKRVQPIAVAAWLDRTPVGLVLAEVPVDHDGKPEILSLYTAPERRNQGLATAMVARVEQLLHDRGFGEVHAVYMTGKRGISAVETILAKRQWSTPEARMLILRSPLADFHSMPWFSRVTLPKPDFEIFSWTDLRPEERAQLECSQTQGPWIGDGLEPWRHDLRGFEPFSSVGLRHQGSVVGWVISHRASPDTVRYTCSFIRKDLGRRGRILPLYTESIRRAEQAGFRVGTFTTPLSFTSMVGFVKNRCAPWARFVGETRGARKILGDLVS